MSIRNVAAFWPPGTVVTFHHDEPFWQDPRQSYPNPPASLVGVRGHFATGTVDSNGNIDFPEDPKPSNYQSGTGATFYAHALGKTVAYSVDRSNPQRETVGERNRRQTAALRPVQYAGERQAAPGEHRPYYPEWHNHGNPDSA